MIKKIEQKFGQLVEKSPNYVTPGTPWKILMKEKGMIVKKSEEKLYQTGVG